MEYQNNADTVLGNLDCKLESTIYPFAEFNDTIIAETNKYFICARSSLSGINFYDTKDYYSLLSNTYISTTTAIDAKDRIDRAVSNGGWGITGAHAITEYAGGEYEPCPYVVFGQVYAYLRHKIDANQIWNDSLTNVGKYLRERQSAAAIVKSQNSTQIIIELVHTLTNTIFATYDFPLTLKNGGAQYMDRQSCSCSGCDYSQYVYSN